jgi:iron complex transport system ATP-binding protein
VTARADSAARPGPPEIRLDGASVRYGKARALGPVSLRFPPGSFAAILGPNGAGKSTLVRALTRLVPLVEGAIFYGERDLQRLPPDAVARLVGVVPQDVWVPFPFSVLEMVLMGRTPHLGSMGLETQHDVEIARRALERLDILHLQDRAVQTLSGGERQRVLLARALAQDVPVLLLDEPTAHLDIAHQQRTLDLLAELNREGRTVLAVLHDLNLASLYCRRLVLLGGGEVTADGEPERVLTEDRLRTVYGADVVVGAHPQTGQPVVLPCAPAHLNAPAP